AAPPAPTIETRPKDCPSSTAASVLVPKMRPSRKTSVFTDAASASSQRAAAASLYGAVTLAPTSPAAASPRTASAKRSRGTSRATYTQSTPHAANAAFCIRGESECATGCPSSATTHVVPLIAMRVRVVLEVAVARREEVMHVIRLPHEVEVVDLRRTRGRLQ